MTPAYWALGAACAALSLVWLVYLWVAAQLHAFDERIQKLEARRQERYGVTSLKRVPPGYRMEEKG